MPQPSDDWHGLIGQPVDHIDTPAAVVDLDAMERNLQRMAAFAHRHGVRLRPHAKMHKSAELARQQMAAGAVGVCVQKASEAQALWAGGVHNIFISNQVLAAEKLERLRTLSDAMAAQDGQLALAVDSALGVHRLARAFADAPAALDVFVELDVGQGRCGVSDAATALALAQQVAAAPGLRFAGVQAYHGAAQHLRSSHERAAAVQQAVAFVVQTRAVLTQAQLPPPLVTGAGTGSFALEAASGVYGELQAGSYLFMDADYARNQVGTDEPQFEQALFIKAAVMSRGPKHAVCDAGHKSHAIDSGLPTVWGQALQCVACSDEHTTLRGAALPALGDTVWLVPGHCDPTVNLHDTLIGVRGGLVRGQVERLIAVDARGALR